MTNILRVTKVSKCFLSPLFCDVETAGLVLQKGFYYLGKLQGKVIVFAAVVMDRYAPSLLAQEVQKVSRIHLLCVY